MKEKQIEEMAKDLNSSIAIMTTESFSDCLDIAKFLVDLDYRKIDKDNVVVLTRDDYEAMQIKIEQLTKYAENERQLREYYCKEMAEKIYKEYLCDILSLEAKEEFAKQFGIEIK